MAEIRCPTCGKPIDSEKTSTPPFCGERCRLIDLGGWLDERFGMPVEPSEEEIEAWPEQW